MGNLPSNDDDDHNVIIFILWWWWWWLWWWFDYLYIMPMFGGVCACVAIIHNFLRKMSTFYVSLSVCYVLSSLSALPSNMFPTLLILLLMKKMKIAIMKWSSFRGWYESVQPFNSPQRQPLAIDFRLYTFFWWCWWNSKTIHEWSAWQFCLTTLEMMRTMMTQSWKNAVTPQT